MSDKEIKRSMAVHPAPVERNAMGEMDFPAQYDRRWADNEYRNTYARNWKGEWGYRVTRVTNSTAYRPGTLLTKDEIEQLIAEDWTVSIMSK